MATLREDHAYFFTSCAATSLRIFETHGNIILRSLRGLDILLYSIYTVHGVVQIFITILSPAEDPPVGLPAVR